MTLLSTLFLGGCSDFWCWPFECDSSSSGVETSSTGAVATSTTSSEVRTSSTAAVVSSTTASEFDLSRVTWLHTDVSGWAETTSLSVEIGAGVICLNFDKSASWPSASIDHTSGTRKINVNANPLVFVNHGGQWYGGTWEWFTPGNGCKPMTSVAGDHIKVAPLVDWVPATGEEIYFMAAGLSRSASITNVQERSQPVKVIWP